MRAVGVEVGGQSTLVLVLVLLLFLLRTKVEANDAQDGGADQERDRGQGNEDSYCCSSARGD